MYTIQKFKDIISKITLFAGIILFFAVMSQNIRIIIGQSVNIFMLPLINIIGKSNFYIVIFALSLLTSLYSSIIQKYTINQNKINELQGKIKNLQSDMKNAKQNNNYASIKKLELEQLELMKEQTNMMKDQIKPMFYVIVISLPIFMWIYYYISQNSGIYMCFPIWGDKLLSDHIFYTLQYWIYWYFITSLSCGQIAKKLLTNNNRM